MGISGLLCCRANSRQRFINQLFFPGCSFIFPIRMVSSFFRRWKPPGRGKVFSCSTIKNLPWGIKLMWASSSCFSSSSSSFFQYTIFVMAARCQTDDWQQFCRCTIMQVQRLSKIGQSLRDQATNAKNFGAYSKLQLDQWHHQRYRESHFFLHNRNLQSWYSASDFWEPLR